MRLLAVTAAYPHRGHIFSGAFSELLVQAMKGLCGHITVLCPRPWVPPLVAFRGKWQAYRAIPPCESRGGVDIYRPAVLQVPKIGTAFWNGSGAYLCCRRAAARLHGRRRFDAIFSYDLAAAGPLAWRLGAWLGIPACGWASGSDARAPAGSAAGRSLYRTIQNLDHVFYQSRELLELGRRCLAAHGGRLQPEKHMVLPHGIPPAPPRPGRDLLQARRRECGIPDGRVVLLWLGRVTRKKGAHELLRAVSIMAGRNPSIHCLMVGSMPAFDETRAVRALIEADALLREHVTIVPACAPEDVWNFLYMADIFAFTSHQEGSPNGLLEAMAAELPCAAFAIPAVQEVAAGGQGIVTAPPFDCHAFAAAVLKLADSPRLRREVGTQAKRIIEARYSLQANMAQACDQIARMVSSRGRPPAARETGPV